MKRLGTLPGFLVHGREERFELVGLKTVFIFAEGEWLCFGTKSFTVMESSSSRGMVTIVVGQVRDELIVDSRVTLVIFGKFDVEGEVVCVG